jgi:farsoic acid methyltransferase
VSFSVRACHDAQLALSALPLVTDTAAYQVIIGGWENTKSALRKNMGYQTDTEVIVDTENILSCEESREFWVAWSDGTIAAGNGHFPFYHVIMQWEDTDFRAITSVGFASGHGSDADWTIITREQGKL